MRRLLISGLIAFCCLLLLSCGSSSSGSDGGSNAASKTNLQSLCGVQQNNKLVNPATNAVLVDIEVVSSDLLIATRRSGGDGPQLVKLHGISSAGVNPLRVQHGIQVLSEALLAGGYYVSAGSSCEFIAEGGGIGVFGQVFSLTGENMAEKMLMQGSANPVAEMCGGDVLAQCYETIGLESRPPSDVELQMQEVNFTSRCGTVVENQLENPVTRAEVVSVEAVNVDTVIVTRLLGVEAGNQQLVKLHGLSQDGISSSRLAQGRNFIASQSSGHAYLVVQSQSCQASFPAGGTGVFAQLYTESGLNINEELLASGYASAASHSCGGELIQSCYQEVQSEAPPPGDTPSNSVIDNFLWKPRSESNGNLVVLVNPVGVRVEVRGAISETLVDHGPSNDRGTTARGNRPGCSYGGNIRVEFFDSSGSRIYLKNGDDAVVVANGCDRMEFRL